MEVSQLKGFRDLNFLAFGKITRKYEKKCERQLRYNEAADNRACVFLRSLKHQPFCKSEKFNSFLFLLRKMSKEMYLTGALKNTEEEILEKHKISCWCSPELLEGNKKRAECDTTNDEIADEDDRNNAKHSRN